MQAKPSGEDLLLALFLMGFHEAAFERIKETVRRRNPGPGSAIEPFWRRLLSKLFSRPSIAQDQPQQ